MRGHRLKGKEPEPSGPVIEPWLADPFLDHDHEPVFAKN
jgi:hypothetical protein